MASIKTIAADIRITDDDRGSFLTVDDNYNLAWSNSRVTASGSVWEYNIVDKDCHIILPSATLSEGFVVAIMRAKKLNGENPRIVILPNKIGDKIMGLDGYYTSSGISYDYNLDKITEYNSDEDDFSSIILKCVKSPTTNEYGWIIINGVGYWNAEEFNEDGIVEYQEKVYNKLKDYAEGYSVTLQTAGVNSLSAGINNTDTEFKPIANIAAFVTPGNATSNKAELLPLNRNQKTPTFVLGRFTDDVKYRAMLYNEFGSAGSSSVNIFGPNDNNWNTPAGITNCVSTNFINNSVSVLGYIYNNNTTESDWWYGLDKKSFSKRFGLRQKGSINSNYINSIGMTQAVVNIRLDNIKLQDGTSPAAPRTIHCLLQNFFEVSDNYTMPYTSVFKAPGNVYSAEDLDTDTTKLTDITVLSTAGLGETNSDSGFSTVVYIPITEKDIAQGSINLIFEFAYRNSGTAIKIQKTEEAFIKFTNASNQYCLLNFLGIEQLKTVSISPEVSFDTMSLIGCSAISDSGAKINYGTFDSATGISDNAFIDGSAAEEEQLNVMGSTGTIGALYKNDTETETTFFSSDGRFYPSNKNVTKTVIQYSTGNDMNTSDGATLNATLTIDWTGRTYQYTGALFFNNNEYVCSTKNSFADTPVSLTFKCVNASNGDIIEKVLENCIDIRYNGLYRLPWICKAYSSANINITNFKTVVNDTALIETLMHYRCGWEAAESEWEPDVLNEYEWDGLVNNPSTSTESISKQCIVPLRNNRLLPYSYEDNNVSNTANTADRIIHYFSTNGSATNGDIGIPSASAFEITSGGDTFSPIVANEFCKLKFNPTVSGTLICNVELPIDCGQSSTGYLIVKETAQTEQYEFVKDSGANINSHQSAGYNTLKINFTDYVVENRLINYFIIIYDAIWTDSTIDAAATVKKPNNSVIARYRPVQALQNSNIKTAGINDLKTVHDTKYRGPYLSSTTGYDDMFKTTLIGSSFDREKLFSLLSGPSANIPTSTKNLGASFVFHAYVLKETIA